MLRFGNERLYHHRPMVVSFDSTFFTSILMSIVLKNVLHAKQKRLHFYFIVFFAVQLQEFNLCVLEREHELHKHFMHKLQYIRARVRKPNTRSNKEKWRINIAERKRKKQLRNLYACALFALYLVQFDSSFLFFSCWLTATIVLNRWMWNFMQN